jgi:hypothetical protein
VAAVWCFEGLGGSELAAFCHQSGFSSALQCSSCRELEQFNLQPLVESCNQCCHPDTDVQAKPVSRYFNH